MKSILMGGNRTLQVYSPDLVNTLVQCAGLDPRVYTKEELLENPALCRDADYIFSTWGMPVFSEAEIDDLFPVLKAVFYGAGSVQKFARPFLNKGIAVFSAWAANAVPVAEYTVSQIILANKGYFQTCAGYRGPENRKEMQELFHQYPGNYGCGVGIVGAGMIGRMVMERLRQFRLDVLVYDPYFPAERAKELGATPASLEEIFSTCQTISNHVANIPQTVGMYNYDLFSRMKPYATFINTGRGAQVVEADLARALEEVPTRTAVLDVTYPEPPRPDCPLLGLPNVFFTPHIAGSAGDEVCRMGEFMVEEFRRYTSGMETRYQVTLKMLETMA